MSEAIKDHYYNLKGNLYKENYGINFFHYINYMKLLFYLIV